MLARCALLLLSPAVLLGQTPEKYRDAIRAVEAMVERERRDASVPGISIALVEDQTVLWSKGFGHADLAKTRPATPETVYRVGSVSKLFTVLGLMQLAEDGKIDPDAPVTKYLPDFRPAGGGADKITLRMLMAHRSGLVREPARGHIYEPKPLTLAETVASLNDTALVYKPGTEMASSYASNAGIAAVGLAIEKVDGRPFPKAVRERILVPLGMTASDFERTPAVKKDLAEGMMWTYHGREFPAPTFDLGIAPAVGMYATANDLARFMSALFAGGRGARGQVCREITLQEMFRPQFTHEGAHAGYGLGFFVYFLDGHQRIGHSGALYGFSTDLAFLPAEKLGVVVLANKDAAESLTWRIADAALRHLLAARADKPLPKLDEPKPVSRETARKVAGKYGDSPTHELIEADGKLYYLAPEGELLQEVWAVGPEFVTHGAVASGVRFTCDGKTLKTSGPKGESFLRAPDSSGTPADAPEHFRGLLGEYGWDHNTSYILEKDGKLHLLVGGFNLCALQEETKNVFRSPASGIFHGAKLVFRRGPGGKATEFEAAHIVFKRRPLDGEDGRTFRIKPLRPVEELRKEAMAASPPEEKGDFRKADLVELTALDPDIKTDLRYASDNNFMGTPLYPKTAKAYMQRPAAEALVRVNKALVEKGYGLWVFDAYRPWAVTKMFWEATPEKMRMFVADPSKGSRHNRGCAVDLSLYDRKTGKPVEMVSGFDEFSDRAYPHYWGGTSRQRWHRQLLRWSMEDQGFTVYEAEWWHFDFKDWKSYRIGNESFEELQK